MEQEDKESLFNGIKQEKTILFKAFIYLYWIIFSVLCYKFFKQLDGFSVDLLKRSLV
jgi:hypothetical protein